MNTDKYSFQIFWSDIDNCYFATVSEFPGLSAFGDTPEKAISEAKVVLSMFIETMIEDGEEIPAPRTLEDFSGQLRLRLPKSLHASLQKHAEMENVSLNSLITYLLTDKLSRNEALDAAIDKICDHFDTTVNDIKQNNVHLGKYFINSFHIEQSKRQASQIISEKKYIERFN